MRIIRKNWEKLGKIGKNWEKLGKNGKNWEKLRKIDFLFGKNLFLIWEKFISHLGIIYFSFEKNLKKLGKIRKNLEKLGKIRKNLEK